MRCVWRWNWPPECVQNGLVLYLLPHVSHQVYDKGPSPYKSLVTAFRTIAREEGARALYQVRPTCAVVYHRLNSCSAIHESLGFMDGLRLRRRSAPCIHRLVFEWVECWSVLALYCCCRRDTIHTILLRASPGLGKYTARGFDQPHRQERIA